MGKALSGDFIGFTFNGVHSSTLGIMRVSNGSRYVEDLLPTYQDKVVEVPNSDGTYYFGANYKQKVIQISFVFDELTEYQIRKLKQVFSDKQIHELWFDETPYKAYNVKVNGIPNLKYICFDEKDEHSEPIRIYKGEGSVSFIAYYPFAYSRFKYLDDYDTSFSNINEWIGASGLKLKTKYDTPINPAPGKREIPLWNAGDLETDFKINFYFEGEKELTAGYLKIGQNDILEFSKIQKQGEDIGIQIDTKLKLVQGFIIDGDNFIFTGNIYNKYITSGDFFKIPLGESKMLIEGLFGSNKGKLEIDYKYWYL